MSVFQQMMKNQKDFWITITFGECCENRTGNQKIGKKASLGGGFSVQDLINTKNIFENYGVVCSLVNLNPLKENDAAILVVRGGINALMKDSNINYDILEKELKNCNWDKKALDSDGKVVNLIARHNLCFADVGQNANYEKGEGTIISFSELPNLQIVREALPKFLGEKAQNLFAEGNYYYDKHKCFISYHGDFERRKVVGLRFGSTMPIFYQWFKDGKPFGETTKIELEPGDLYIMSEKAVGTDNNKNMALKHAAGFERNISVKSNTQTTHSSQQSITQSIQKSIPQTDKQTIERKTNKNIYDLLYSNFPEIRQVLNNVGVLDIDSLMKNPYAALIGVIVGQKISFKRAKEMRKKLYTILGGTDFTIEQFVSLQDEFKSFETYPIIERVNNFLQNKSKDFLYSEKNIRSLVEIEGIGPWTIDSTVLCCFTKLFDANIDIFPSGDKFLQNALTVLNLNKDNKKVTASGAKKISEKWSPYRGYVTWYLWRWFPEIRNISSAQTSASLCCATK